MTLRLGAVMARPISQLAAVKPLRMGNKGMHCRVNFPFTTRLFPMTYMRNPAISCRSFSVFSKFPSLHQHPSFAKGNTMNQILLSFFVHQWRNSLKENPRELDLAYGKLINPSAESLEALLHVLAKEDHHLEDITLPFSMLNKEWLKNFFEVLKRKNPVLCGIAMCNNNVSLFAPMKFYPKANLMALLELEKIMMRSPANVWGYQMQEILLDDKAIEILSTHIMNMQSRNRTITLILSKNSESYHKP